MSTGRGPQIASAPAAFALDEVACRFGASVAVETATMQIPAGVMLGLVGPSGSGKTTIVRLLTGGVAPTAGTVRVLGRDPRRMPSGERRRLGYMPQLFSLYPGLTTRENVDFMASLFGMFLPSRRRRTREVLQAVDLWDVRDRRAADLSGGMQRRLELAATFVHDPDLLLLDEPTAGLDPLLRTKVWEQLRRLRDAGRTILVTTQYVGEAEECDLVALVVEGRLVAMGTPSELRIQVAGGELLDIETDRELSSEDFRGLPGFIALQPLGSRKVRVTVDSAATALPSVVNVLADREAAVVAASELRLSFDDVFAALVARVRGQEPPALLPDLPQRAPATGPSMAAAADREVPA